MTDDKKLSKAEALRGLWADLEAERLQEEAESMTEEEPIAAEKADGSHEAMERAYANVDKAFAEAHAKAAKAEKPQSNVVDIRSAKRWSTLNVATSMATAFVAAACLVLVLGRLNKLPSGAYPTPTSTATAAGGQGDPKADAAFQLALRECATDEYDQCLRDLDYAKEVDPSIATDGAWVYCHAKATRLLELQKKQKGGP